jgi:polyferredoxin
MPETFPDMQQKSATTKYAAPEKGDFRALLDVKAPDRPRWTAWAAIKFALALLLSPLVLLVLLLDWAHLIALFALGSVSLYVGVVQWQTNDWLITLVAVGAGLALTFGVLLYARDKVRGKV